ncbi:hypothetical protein Pla111_27990 [Botrimarina hoheduenensis]|uniref:Uncharacterized protein n=1 Tax=Botrimarina hoheduenensis TaxID=2528000 RepID=A0A5C5VV65_9BACT|nr:hypothetical protein Pla111_27990 [Botrimarina hoheduenensis]
MGGSVDVTLVFAGGLATDRFPHHLATVRDGGEHAILAGGELQGLHRPRRLPVSPSSRRCPSPQRISRGEKPSTTYRFCAAVLVVAKSKGVPRLSTERRLFNPHQRDGS